MKNCATSCMLPKKITMPTRASGALVEHDLEHTKTANSFFIIKLRILLFFFLIGAQNADEMPEKTPIATTTTNTAECALAEQPAVGPCRV